MIFRNVMKCLKEKRSCLKLTFVAAPSLYFTDSKEREMLGIWCQLLILLLKMMMRWRTLMFARRRGVREKDCYYNFLSLEIDRMMLERSLDFFLIQSCITDWIRSREMRVFSYCLGERKTFSLSFTSFSRSHNQYRMKRMWKMWSQLLLLYKHTQSLTVFHSLTDIW